tara:strand:+ start:60 stop:1229 length:1170 start_codon:yes stop_codon:yes gene_type:complete
MVGTVKLGSVNFPKLLRHLGHRTNQVRDLVFARDPIYRKEVMTTKADSTSGRSGGTTSLSGPAVSFGYEESSSATQSAGTDAAYHVNSPELILPGLKAIQSPITSRSGRLERTGHRISGECTFYLPPLSHIRRMPEFGETALFAEIETYDKLIDMEQILFSAFDSQDITKFQASLGGEIDGRFVSYNGYNNRGYSVAGAWITDGENDDTSVYYDTATGGTRAPAFEMDRVQFQIKSGGTLDYVQFTGKVGGSTVDLKWDGNLALNSSEFVTIDLPLRKDNGEPFSVGDTTLVYKDGVAYTFTAATENGTIADLNKMVGVTAADPDGSENYFDRFQIFLTESVAQEVKHLRMYKAAEWRVESIKDYRDEYMEVKAVRVRGERISRRRAYG